MKIGSDRFSLEYESSQGFFSCCCIKELFLATINTGWLIRDKFINLKFIVGIYIFLYSCFVLMSIVRSTINKIKLNWIKLT